MRVSWLVIAAVIAAVVGAAGCDKKPSGPTPAEVAEEYRARIDALGAKIVQLERKLADAPMVELPAKLEPPIVMKDSGASEPGNAVALKWKYLQRAWEQTEIPMTTLLMALSWLHGPYGIHPGGDPVFMRRVFEDGIKTRYAVIIRDVAAHPPKLIDEKTFEAGFAIARIYVYDLVQDKLLGNVEVKATTPPELEYKYSTTAGQNDAAMSALFQSIEADLKKKVIARLRSLGDVKLSY